jgi:hypothetical protein
MNENRIKHTIDTRLSGVEFTLKNKRAVFAIAKGEQKVKKKLSVGLVLAIVLVLATITAVAAVLLSAREFAEQVAVPMAQQSEGDSYTVEETNLLLKLAEENGIVLSEGARTQIEVFLADGQGYYKEELLMALTKAEFGEDTILWTLEEQKWFADACVAIGFVQTAAEILPAEGEMTEAQARQIAHDYIYAHYDQQRDLNDATYYKQGIQYLDGNVDEAYPGRYWVVHYEPLVLDAAQYAISINIKGEVWDAYMYPGVAEGASYDVIWNRYRRELSDFSLWTQKDLRVFKRALEMSSSVDEPMVVFIKQMAYPDIAQNAITREAACEIAVKSLNQTQDAFERAVYIGGEPNPIWRVRLFAYDETRNDAISENYRLLYIEVDSITGEIKGSYEQNMDDDRMGFLIISQRVMEETGPMKGEEGALFGSILMKHINVLGWEFGAWSQDELRGLKKEIEERVSTNEIAALCIKQTDYPNIAENAITPQEAGKIALDSLGLSEGKIRNVVYMGSAPNPIWKVDLWLLNTGNDDVQSESEGYHACYIEVDSVTGEIKNTRNDVYDDYWYFSIVPKDVLDEIEATWGVDSSKSHG